MKERVRDLEDKLKKSKNRSYDNLGTGHRLNISSRQVIVDEDNDNDTSQQRSGENTPVDIKDSDPRFLPSNPCSQPKRVQSTSNEGVRKYFVLNCCPTFAQPSL